MKKKILGIFSVGAIALSPVIATSCSASLKHVNLLANYDNALDALLMLGIAPQHYLSNFASLNDKNLDYATYLNQSLNRAEISPDQAGATPNSTMIHDIRIYDGEDTDLKTLSRLNPYTLLVNEWEKVDSHQYKDIVEHMAYTSMGDTEQARWHESNGDAMDQHMLDIYNGLKKTNGEDHRFATNDYGVSPQKALSMAAKDIDNIYKTGGIFSQRATEINNKLSENIKEWNKSEEFKKFKMLKTTSGATKYSSLDYKETTAPQTATINLGIIMGGRGVGNASSYSLLTPNAIPLFYSGIEDRGLGFSFPQPKNPDTFKNPTKYNETFISAGKNGSSSEVTEQFKGKFDYLIYVSSLQSEKLDVELDYEAFKTLLKKEKQQNVKNNIYDAKYHDIYSAIWGTMGYIHLLEQMKTTIIPHFMKGDTNFNPTTLSTQVSTNKINVPDKTQVRWIEKETDFSQFPKHQY